MNKKLLVAAIGAALVAGPIAAQAAATVYGHAHLSFDVLSIDTTTPSVEDSSNQVVNNSSRFGIRASEDLGGGLKGEAQYELLFTNLETTSGTLSTNRDNWLGLSGGFGAVRLGVIDTATKDVGGIADLFYREQLGESRAIINYASMDARIQNGVHYISPNFGGMTIKAQYGYATEQTLNAAKNESSQMSLNIRGTHGMFTWGLGYLSTDNPSATGASSTDGIRAAVKVNLGALDVAALWQTVSDIGFVSGADRDAFGLGVGFKMGNNYLKAQYYVADDLGNNVDTGAAQLSLGWDYNFSKTTRIYAVYASTENDDNVTSFGIGGNGHGATATPSQNGGKASGFSLGMIMDF